jgi:hypothetical protein
VAVWSEVTLSSFGSRVRIDPEYYQPGNLELANILASKKPVYLGSFSFVTDGIHASPQFAPGSGIRYISAKSVRDGFFDLDNTEEISPAFHKANPRTTLRTDDVIISSVGTIGFCAVVSGAMLPANCDRHVGIVRIRDKEQVDPHYLCAFLNSKYGRFQTLREATGNVQLNLFIYSIAKLQIPLLSQHKKIGDLVRQSLSYREEAGKLYGLASNVFIERLKIPTPDLKPELAYDAKVGALILNDRWDSEFFRPKYRRVAKAMLGGNVKKIGSMSSVIASLTNGHTPLRHDLSEGTVIFLTAEHVHDFRIEYESDKRILALHHKRELARTALTNGDILLTIKGKVGNCAIVNDLDKPTNINQDVALLSLRPGVDKHYVSAWLNSFLGKEMVNQFSTGGINPFLGLGNIRKLPFPIADVKDCAAIGAEVQELVEAGQKSLAESKRAFRQAVGLVESIIEG